MEGKKTYIVAIIMLAIAIAQAFGIDIPGVDRDQDWIPMALNALGLGALRAGVSSSK